MFVEIKQILPKTSYIRENILTKNQGNKFIVYYQTKYPSGKLKADKFQPFKAIVPRRIEITKGLVEMTGLYFGGRQKSIKSRSYQALKFSNSDPEIIRHFINN